MKDWERGLMKRKENWIIYGVDWNGCFQEKFILMYILYKLSHYYSSMRLGIHDHSYLYVVIVEGHVEFPTGLYVHPTLLNLFQVLSRMCYKNWVFWFVGHGASLMWAECHCWKRVTPFFLTLCDVSPRAIH